MTEVSVSNASLDRASDLAIELSEELVALFANAQNTAQLKLPLDGEEQACEAFMVERKQLKAVIDAQEEEISSLRTSLSQELQGQSAYRAGLRSEIQRLKDANATSNAVLQHLADYANQLQERLNSIGIAHRADPESGVPMIEVDPIRLLETLQGIANDRMAPIDL